MKLSLFLATLFVLFSSSLAENTNFLLKTTGAKQLVQFVSDAPLEKIVGRAEEISGGVALDLSNLASRASGSIHVNLKELDTGLSLRNQHMRENHLHTNEFPEATFTITSIVTAEPANISGGGTATTLLRGKLDLHGVTKDYEIMGTLGFDPASGTLHARYKWSILLKDHAIPRPEFLFMKLSDTQQITVDLEFGK